MARIRSVHPGLWTDERFASVSMAARLLFIGIWNECDDQGSFEWSPIKLKMRILPADSVDAGELLAELEAVGNILAYEIGGRKFGAVRNFAQYQRPKKPNSLYPQTDEVRNFTGLKGGEFRNELPTDGEKPPQMEEGGGKGSSVSNETGADAPPGDPQKHFWDTSKTYLIAAGVKSPGGLIGKWRRDHGDEETRSAVNAAQVECASDPVPFIEARLRKTVKLVAVGDGW